MAEIAQLGIGVLIGYALARALKLILAIVGLFLIFLIALQHMGFITVNWDSLTLALESWLNQLITALQNQNLLDATRLSTPLIGTAIGAVLGLRR